MSRPPSDSLQFDLLDGNRRVGWVSGATIGFRGFASETEAASGAWVAHRSVTRRLAQRRGGPAPPTDVEPVTVARGGDREVILAGDKPIATLLRPGADSRAGPESFAFEIEVPVAADELTMRSIAYRVYRTLRNSGAGWARWTTGVPRVEPTKD